MGETTTTRRVESGRAVLVAAAVVLAVGLGVVLGPFPAAVGDASTGDRELAGRLAELAGPGRVGLSAAVVTPTGTRIAAVGDDGVGGPLTADTPVEVGSITKTFTGAVFADLVRRGVVRPDERVRDVVPDRPWRPGGAGDVTLEELASHRSGLPAEPVTATTLLGNYGNGLFGLRPYRSDAAGIFAAADAATPSGRGTWSYSNLGVALLGHALAARAGTEYPELLASTVTRPLGMASTVAPAADPPPGAAVGHDGKGRPVQDWVDPGDAPAGAGVFTTTADMAAYARAVLTGWGPATEAAVPRWPAGTRQIGYAWYTRGSSNPVLWHNGSSGGMTSSIVVDRARGQAVVVLGTTTEAVDDVAFALADVPYSPRTAVSTALDSPAGTAVGIIAPLLAGASLLAASRGGWTRRPGRAVRSGVVAAAGGALILFALAVAYGPATWLVAPFWLVGCALAGAGVATAVLGWEEMDRGAGLRWTGAIAALVIGVGLAAGVSGVLV